MTHATSEVLASLYQGILGRAPDEIGLTFYLAEIDSGRLSISDIARGMTLSAEFACFKADDARDLGDQSSARRVDIELLSRHRANPTDLFAENGCFTNWLGVRTDADIFPNGDLFRNRMMVDIPATGAGDGVFGGYLEYIALLTAIEATPDRSAFTAVEIGAGWGPWISACGVVCRNLGFGRIVLRGVEADAARHDLMRRHLLRNGLMNTPGIDSTTWRGAVWTQDTTLHFPVIDPRDAGGAASAEGQDRDYRGHASHFIEVPAFSLASVCAGLGRIDFMHCDIQGAELAVLEGSIDLLNAQVRQLFVGTHSRVIDGGLIGLFHRHGWDILAELPCHFDYDRSIPTLEGMTKRDGEIFVRNPRLG